MPVEKNPPAQLRLIRTIQVINNLSILLQIITGVATTQVTSPKETVAIRLRNPLDVTEPTMATAIAVISGTTTGIVTTGLFPLLVSVETQAVVAAQGVTAVVETTMTTTGGLMTTVATLAMIAMTMIAEIRAMMTTMITQ